MKKVFAIVFALAVMLSVTACGAATSGGGSVADKDVTKEVAKETFSCDVSNVDFTIGDGEKEVVIKSGDGENRNEYFTWETSDEKIVTVNKGKIAAIGVGEADVHAYLSEAFLKANGFDREWSFDFHVTAKDRSDAAYLFFKKYGAFNEDTKNYSFRNYRSERDDEKETIDYINEEATYYYYSGKIYISFERRHTEKNGNYNTYIGHVSFTWGDLENGYFSAEWNRNGSHVIRMHFFNEYISFDDETQNVKLNYEKKCVEQTNSGGALNQMNLESNVLAYFQPIIDGLDYLNGILTENNADIRLLQ